MPKTCIQSIGDEQVMLIDFWLRIFKVHDI